MGIRALLPTVVVICAFAQSPPPVVPPSTVIKANVEEVSIDLIVRDKNGRPIRDLRPEEVHITDDGAPSAIKTLRLIRRGQSSGAEQNKTSRGVTDPLREFRLVSLLFDRQNSFSARLAREAASELIKSAGSSPDVYFSVWQIRDDIRLLQQFTTDEAALKRAIEIATALRRHVPVSDDVSKEFIHSFASGPQAESQIMNGDLAAVGLSGGGGGPAATFAAAAMAASQERLVALQLRILDTSRRIEQEQSAAPSIAALLALVREQDRIPGRKTILYLSDGLQMTSRTAEKFRNIVSTANRAGVSIYAVDTSGLNQDVVSDASQMTMSSVQLGTPQIGMTDSAGRSDALAATALDGAARPLRNLDLTLNSNQQSPMKELAAATGGIFIGNSNDPRKWIHRVAEDINTYYEATYSPPTQNYDGHFRSISVRVDRPHAIVQSRSGYFSLPPGAGAGVAAFEMPLLKALEENPAKESIPLNAEVVRFGPRKGKVQASLVIEVPLSKIAYGRDEAANIDKAHIGLLALVKRANGEIVHKISADFGLERAIDSVDPSRSDTFTFERPFEIAPGDYRMEIAVSDQQGAQLGTKTVAFSVPPLANGVGLSDISLISHAEPLMNSVALDDPFRVGARHIVPRLIAGAHSDSASELPLFFVIYPDLDNRNKPRLDLELTRDNRPLGSRPMELPEAQPGQAIPYITAIRRDSLAPGSYELLAKVSQGSESREESLHFVIEGRMPAETATKIPAENVVALDLLLKPKLLEGEQAPANDKIQTILAAARQRVLDYTKDLPNLVCIERTLRSIDPTGRASWKPKDRITRLLRYTDGEERGEILDFNGRHGFEDAIGGVQLSGEFGGLLGMVFSDRAAPKIDWQGFTEINGARMHVFRYRVSRERSTYAVIGSPDRPALQTAYSALVYVDINTLAVRRVSVQAEGLPANFPIHESAITVDYDYVPLGGHDYLLPQQAQLLVRERAHYLKKNEIQFLNYRRYGAESKIKFQ